MHSELPVVQKTYELLLWMAPTIQKLPRSHRFVLGERLKSSLYLLLEDLVRVRFARPNGVWVDGSTGPHFEPLLITEDNVRWVVFRVWRRALRLPVVRDLFVADEEPFADVS